MMKKLLLGLLIVAMAAPVVAKVKPKHLAGTWNYTVHTDQGSMTGILKFTREKKELKGEVVTDNGMNFPMNKLEIKEGDVLYFEVTPDYEPIRVSLKINGESFEGTGATDQGEVPITGQKQN